MSETHYHAESDSGERNTWVDWTFALFWFADTALVGTPLFELPNYMVYALAPLWLLTSRLRPAHRNAFLATFLGFMLWHGVCLLTGQSLVVGWLFTEFRLKIAAVAFLFLLRTRSVHQLWLFSKASFLGCVGVALASLVWGGDNLVQGRLVGVTLEANVFGRILGWGYGVGLLSALAGGKFWKLSYAVYVVLAGILVLKSGSRGALITAGAFLFAFFMLEYVRYAGRNLRWLLPVGGVAILLAISVPLFFSETAVYQRMFSEDATIADDARVSLYRDSFRMFLQYPIFGVGPGVFAEMQGKFFFTHATPVQLLVDGGALMFILYYLMIGLLWRWTSVILQYVREDDSNRRFLNAIRATLMLIVACGLANVIVLDRQSTVFMCVLASALYPIYSRLRAQTHPVDSYGHYSGAEVSIQQSASY